MQAALLFLLFSFLIILGILISMLYVVRQQSVAIVERFGRYQKNCNEWDSYAFTIWYR